MCKLREGAVRQEGDSGGEKMTNIDLSWMFSCLVGAVRTPRSFSLPLSLIPSLSLPLSPCDHRSPTSFLQGHKYFPQTPYCFHIILQTPPNDSERQTMHPFSRDCHASLCSYTFYSGWRTYTYTMRGQQQRVPQTLHLKWYIKATCLKILHMIDVGNDSVFSVWKSYVCFSLHFRSPRKENARAPKHDKKNNNKKEEGQYCQS